MMIRTHALILALTTGWVGASLGASPATPSYVGIETSIARIQADWQKPGQASPNVESWQTLFAAIRADLKTYAMAKTGEERFAILAHLNAITTQLNSYSWAPAVDLRQSLEAWLSPRLVLAEAERSLISTIRSLPTSADGTIQSNRDKWVRFVSETVNTALRDYEGASEVRLKHEALTKVYQALNALNKRNQDAAWGPSLALQTALNTLYNGPNLHATADVNAVSPRLANNLVESGPVYHKGQISYVTAGPYMGFGLMASDDGIVFYNRQALSSVTPVNGFQQQIASNPKGRGIAKLYEFNATTYDQSVLTVIAVLRPSGLQVFPDSTHSTDAAIGETPQPGKGFGRALLAMIGFGPRKVTQKVYDNAIGEIRSSVVVEAREETEEKTAVRTAETNNQLSQFLIGGDRLAVKTVEIDGLKLRSRPEFVLIDGRLLWRGASEQIGSDFPKPSTLNSVSSGVAADVHLSSIATNFARGYLQGDKARSTKNLMVVTRKILPGAPPASGFELSENVDYPTFLKAVETTQALNDPKLLAIRVKKPGRSPDFSVDRNGFLVALIHDFQIEVPAPESARKGGLAGPPARVYRMEAPNAELVISYRVEPAKENVPIKISGRIEGFDAGPGATVYAINEEETKAQALSPFQSTIIMGVFGSRLKGQPIDVPLSNLNLPGYQISSVSNLDPSGWMRVVLTPAPAAAKPVENPTNVARH